MTESESEERKSGGAIWRRRGKRAWRMWGWFDRFRWIGSLFKTKAELGLALASAGVVTTVAGVGVPQVKLSQSSGFEPLDQAALELLELAVQSAVLPETLRGRQFALTLPIHFRLDD